MEGETLLLKGEIVPGDYESLLDAIRRDVDRFWRAKSITLASLGGDIQEALRIARLVKGTYSYVVVGDANGPCVSACFFIFSAATERSATDPNLGIHRPYIHQRRLVSMGVREAEALQNDALRQARSYLENLNVPASLIDKMFQRASTEVYWLSRDEIQEQLGRRPPWFEQFLIARCGFNKALECKYYSTNDKIILDHMNAVVRCGHQLTTSEAKSFLISEQ